MNDDLFTSSYDNYFNEKKSQNKKKLKTVGTRIKILKVLVVTIFVVIFLELGLYFLVFPLVSQTEIFFTGISAENEKIYRDSAHSLFDKKNWFLLNEPTIAGFFYANYPNIENVSVKKVFPNQIFVDIQEREPVATSIVLIQGESVPILIDRRGIVYQIGGSMAFSYSPLLSGLNFTELHVGTRLHENFLSLLSKLDEMRKECPAYLAGISEIKIVAKNYGSFYLEIYPVKSKIKVLVDRNFDKRTLEYMMILVDVVQNLSVGIYEVDLRYGACSFKKRQ